MGLQMWGEAVDLPQSLWWWVTSMDTLVVTGVYWRYQVPAAIYRISVYRPIVNPK